MRLLLAVVAGVVALVLAVAFLAGLAARAAVEGQRERLIARAAAALGRPITVERIEPSFWPLGARLRGLEVGDDPAFGAAPFLAADAAVIRVRLWGLLRGRVETSGLLVRRPRLQLVRNASGRWNVASLGDDSEPGEEGGGPPRERASGARMSGVLFLGVVRGEIRDGTVAVRDLTGARPRELTIRRLRVRAENLYAGGDARLRIEAAVRDERPNLRLEVRVPALGARDPRDTPFELESRGEEIDLTPFADLLADARLTRFAAAARGTAERFAGTLDVAWTREPAEGDAVDGTLRLRAARASERVTIEEVAGDAGGVAWTAAGTATLDEDGTRIDELRAVVDGVPLEVTGRVRALAPPVLDLRFAGRPFAGTLEGTAAAEGDGAIRVHAECTDVDLRAVGEHIGTADARRLAGRAEGTLDLELGREPIRGGGRLQVSEGRIGGVNLARLILGTFDAIPLLPSLFGSEGTAGSPELAGPDTNIERATIPFTIAEGRIRSEGVRLVADAFEIAGNGWIDVERHLRFTGDLVLAPQVSRALTSGLGVLRVLRLDDQRLSVPFRVRGRVGKARIEPDLGRLRDRGLALLGRRAKSDDDDEEDERSRTRPEHGIGEALLDHIERLVEP